MPMRGSARNVSSTPQVNAPWEPPPCRARLMVRMAVSCKFRAEAGPDAPPLALSRVHGWLEPLQTWYISRFAGGVPEWLKGADCKSVGLRLRWFESSLLHQASREARRCASDDRVVAEGKPAGRWVGGAAEGLVDCARCGCSSMVEP